MKLFIALLVLSLGVLALPARAEQLYRCECCAAYFGKDPAAPTYWNRGLGYGRLVADRKYEETLSRFNDAFRRGRPYTIEDIAWVNEALFSLGAIKSGIHDPNIRFMYYLAEQPKDEVAHDLWWMREKYGGKIWDQAAIEQYAEPALCTISEVRKKYPQYPVAFLRHISILIAIGRFEEVLTIVRGLNKDSIAILGPLGEYLAKTMSQYIGISRFEEGAAFLATVKKAHGIKKETEELWTARLLRGTQEAPLPAAEKKRIQAKIRAM